MPTASWSGSASKRGGTVRIGGFATVLNRLVSRAVLSLAITDPGIDPRIFEIDERDGLRRLRAGELDLLLSERPGPDQPRRPAGIHETDLLHDPFRIVVPDSWAGTDDVRALLSGPWVLSDDQTPSRRALEGVATAHGLSLDVRHVGRESATMLALVSAGLGAAIIPSLTLRNQPWGRVRLHTGPPEPGARMLTVLHPADDDPPPVARFVDELRRQAHAEEQRDAESE